MRHPHAEKPMHRRLFPLATICATLALGACSSAPPMRFHTLMPSETPAAQAGSAGKVGAIVLEPIRLPAQVDQPQWFVRLPDDSVAVLEQDRWTSPLRDELRQALLERLVVRWGASTARPPANAAPPVRIGVDVRRFDGVVGRESHIEGSWTLVAGEPALRVAHCEWSIRERAEPDTAGLAAAHRRAVERLGDAIGGAAAAAAKRQPVNCPPSDPAS